MTKSTSPFESHPPSAKRLTLTVLAAIALSALVLVTLVMPAEYGLDPLGTGRVLGLLKNNSHTNAPVLTDTLGGNEKFVPTAAPSTKSKKSPDPIPLPNRNVQQSETIPAKSQTIKIVIEPYEQAEVKAAMQTGKMMLYSWNVARGGVYTDFHGHDPEWANKEAFVRYEEHQESTGGNGSLVAPFKGEHGWYWINFNTYPVTITLTLQGYFDKIIQYGDKGEKSPT